MTYIRSEVPADHEAVRWVNEHAFGRPDEALLVSALRERARPVISLVAEIQERVVGHIMFSPGSLSGHGDSDVMVLAPMAVAPARQGGGLGSLLVREGLAECGRLGVGAVVVLGHADFYPRFGFVPASDYGLSCAYEVPAEAFMAVELRAGYLSGRPGTVRFHPAFDDL
ncbi:GNAT family N-acetyltransferase [Arhodomonas sp. AD133]|uniref:GNAT family N-acetyltransferase n=1 Tax=Arhodomonas sp. AD133 TaxID=3415009 RepID=UPI003EBEAD7F